jgi:DNA replication protein DnaC
VSSDLEPFLKRLHLANARRVWRDLVQRAEKEDWSYELLLFTLFSEEVAHRRGTRLTRALRSAAFPFLRTIEEFDFTYQSSLRLTTVGSLLAPDFVTEGRAVILEGKPGSRNGRRELEPFRIVGRDGQPGRAPECGLPPAGGYGARACSRK